MLNTLYMVLVLSLAVSAVSVTISKAGVFSWLRKWIASRNEWLGKLISCSYCMSHWIAIAVVCVYQPVLIKPYYILGLIVSIFVIVAVSAMVSGVIMYLNSFRGDEDDVIEESEIQQQLSNLHQALQAAKNKIVEQQKTIEELKNKKG